MSLKQKIKKTLSQSGSPSRLGFAFALGILLGVLPGTGAIVAAGLATVLGLNLPLAVAGAMLINPLTAPLVYGGSYFLGAWLLGNTHLEKTISRVLLTTLAGNVLMAVVMAAAGYVAVWGIVVWYRSRKKPHAACD